MGTRLLWVVLADRGHARMLRCELTESGSYRVEDVDALHLETRNWKRSGSGPMRKNRFTTFGIEDSSDREDLARSARSISDWIGKKAKSLTIHRFGLISPARFLGAMRKHLPRDLKRKVIEQKGDLVHLSPSLLSKHPTIRKLVETPIDDG